METEWVSGPPFSQRSPTLIIDSVHLPAGFNWIGQKDLATRSQGSSTQISCPGTPRCSGNLAVMRLWSGNVQKTTAKAAGQAVGGSVCRFTSFSIKYGFETYYSILFSIIPIHTMIWGDGDPTLGFNKLPEL